MVKLPVINIGFGNMVMTSKIVAVINPNSSPMKKFKEEARERSKLIDATEGKKTRSIVVTDSGYIILSAINSETIAQRITAGTEDEHPSR